MIHGDVTLFAAPNHVARRGAERVLDAGGGADQHHQAIGLPEQRLRPGRGRDGRLAVEAGRGLLERFVDQLQPVVAQLDEIAVRQVLALIDARAIDVAAVVAASVEDDPALGLAGDSRVATRDVALGEAHSVVLTPTNRVLVSCQGNDRLVRLVILDGQLPHEGRSPGHFPPEMNGPDPVMG